MTKVYNTQAEIENLVISFSGGETSAYMCQMDFIKKYKKILVVFANTGQENEETLDFVDAVDRYFNLNVVWVEAAINEKIGVGTGYRLVDYKTADRDGRASFEPMIKKYGIPNMTQPHCTRVLKREPLDKYVHSIFKRGTYDLAIGIRYDELDRMSTKAHERNIIYPLVESKITKKDINLFWSKMPFRLSLKGYQGNCKWCWKKTIRKHVTIMRENPSAFIFPKEMEKYGMSGAYAQKTGEPQRFFRKKMTVLDIKNLSKDKSILDAEDDSIIYDKQYDLDLSGGCGESCEVYSDVDDMERDEK